MSLLDDLTAWLADNPPADMPYFPGAAVTAPFGLRRTAEELRVASPAHLAVDRAGGARFLMPFDGCVFWRPVGGVAGSLLSLNPHGLAMEIQVFHTRASSYGRASRAMRHEGDRLNTSNGYVTELHTRLHKGDALPVTPSNLGMSIKVGEGGDGTHAHTEDVFPYDRELHAWLRAGATPIIIKGSVDIDYVISHCRRYDLPAPTMLEKLRTQIDDWDLEELTDRYAIRSGMPEYRRPEWGRGATIHVDSQWLLRI